MLVDPDALVTAGEIAEIVRGTGYSCMTLYHARTGYDDTYNKAGTFDGQRLIVGPTPWIGELLLKTDAGAGVSNFATTIVNILLETGYDIAYYEAHR